MLLCSYCQISKDSSDLCQQPWINLYSPKLALGYSIWLWKEKKKNLTFWRLSITSPVLLSHVTIIIWLIVFSESRASLMFSKSNWLSQPSVYLRHSPSFIFLCYVSVNISSIFILSTNMSTWNLWFIISLINFLIFLLF